MANLYSYWEERIYLEPIRKRIIIPDKNIDSIEEKEVIQPCCKCDCYDEWNSKDKDGKWYCYKHC